MNDRQLATSHNEELILEIVNSVYKKLKSLNRTAKESLSLFLKIQYVEYPIYIGQNDFDFKSNIKGYIPKGYANDYKPIARDFKYDIMEKFYEENVNFEDILIYIIRHLSYQVIAQTNHTYNDYLKSEISMPYLDTFIKKAEIPILNGRPYRSNYSVIEIPELDFKELDKCTDKEDYVRFYSNIIFDYMNNTTLWVYVNQKKFNELKQIILNFNKENL